MPEAAVEDQSLKGVIIVPPFGPQPRIQLLVAAAVNNGDEDDERQHDAAVDDALNAAPPRVTRLAPDPPFVRWDEGFDAVE